MNCYQESPPVLRDFLAYMSNIEGKSQKTVNEYFHDLRTFFRFLKLSRSLVSKDTEFTEISIDDVDIDFVRSVTLDDGYNFMLFLQQDRGNQSITRRRKVSSLSSFFKYLSQKKMLIDSNPLDALESPKIGKRLPKYLELDQCYTLLNSVDGPFKERDYCILVLFLNCGMRLSELCAINYNSITPEGKLRIIGKGNKERIIYLNEACVTAIKNYMAVRPTEGIHDKNALFISRNMNRMSASAVQRLVQKYLAKSGLGGQGFSVHKLRHTAATLMYQYGGVDIRILKEILGHENLGTTEIYTHLSDSQMESALKSNPLANSKMQRKTDNS